MTHQVKWKDSDLSLEIGKIRCYYRDNWDICEGQWPVVMDESVFDRGGAGDELMAEGVWILMEHRWLPRASITVFDYNFFVHHSWLFLSSLRRWSARHSCIVFVSIYSMTACCHLLSSYSDRLLPRRLSSVSLISLFVSPRMCLCFQLQYIHA